MLEFLTKTNQSNYILLKQMLEGDNKILILNLVNDSNPVLCSVANFALKWDKDKIKEIIDNSSYMDEMLPSRVNLLPYTGSIYRISIKFKNNYGISIIQGFGTYSDSYCEYEIALFNNKSEMNGELFDEEDHHDTVLGYCSREKVLHYIKKLSDL